MRVPLSEIDKGQAQRAAAAGSGAVVLLGAADEIALPPTPLRPRSIYLGWAVVCAWDGPMGAITRQGVGGIFGVGVGGYSGGGSEIPRSGGGRISRRE